MQWSSVAVTDHRNETSMIDTATGERRRVSIEGAGGPFIELPLSQVDEVRRHLDREAIPYWVDSLAISLDGEPETTVIKFSRYVDPARIQSILDEAEEGSGAGRDAGS